MDDRKRVGRTESESVFLLLGKMSLLEEEATFPSSAWSSGWLLRTQKGTAGTEAAGAEVSETHRGWCQPCWPGHRISAGMSPSSRPHPLAVQRRRASLPRQPAARRSPPLHEVSSRGPRPSGRGKIPPNRPLCAARQPGAVRVECRRVDVLGDQRAGLSMRWSSTFLDQGPDQPPIQALSPCQRARCSAAGGWCRFLESG